MKYQAYRNYIARMHSLALEDLHTEPQMTLKDLNGVKAESAETTSVDPPPTITETVREQTRTNPNTGVKNSLVTKVKVAEPAAKKPKKK